MVKKGHIIVLFWLLSFPVFSQGLIAYVTLGPDNAYIGQSVQLKVSVYTTTWFTSGIDIGNIQVDGALTVYFRSLSNTRNFSGKKYAGVEFFYNVFPTDEGVITVPELEILVESPKEGDYKGIKHTIGTKPKTITIKGVPLGYDPNNWLVATSLNVTEKWSASLKNVKVGDVIQRTITRSAGGTLSEFIPQTMWGSIHGISMYPKRPSVSTHKSKTAVSSSRTETVNYLFEKEGEITIPGIEYLYWNSANKKFYKKQIDSINIIVQPNADLEMLASIKKSLQKEKVTEEEKVGPFLLFGMTPKEFFKYLILVIAGVFLPLIIINRIRKWYKQYRLSYLKSEAFAYKQVVRAVGKSDFMEFLIMTNSWLNKLSSTQISLDVFVSRYGTKELNHILNTMNEAYFKTQLSSDRKAFQELNSELKSSRKNYLLQQKKAIKLKKNSNWLNPTISD